MGILRWYKNLSLLFLVFLPLVGIGFIHMTAEGGDRFHYGAAHGVFILMAVVISAFLGYAAYRSYLLELDPSLRYIALGYMGFAFIYTFHGLFTPLAHSHTLAFIIFGPVSRLVMCIYIYLGLRTLLGQHPPDPERKKASWWTCHLVLFAAVSLLAGWAAYGGSFTTQGVKLVEGLSLALSLLSCIRLLLLRRRSSLLRFHLIAQLLFAQTSVAFILGSPWNGLWWFAHAVSAAGFMVLGFAIVRSFEGSHSIGAVYKETLLYPALRSVLQTTHEGFIMTDNSGAVSYANQRLNLFFPEAPRIGQHISSFLESLHMKNSQLRDLTGLVKEFVQGATDVIDVNVEIAGSAAEPAFYEFYAAPVMDEHSQVQIGLLFVFRNRSEEERLNQMKNDFIGIVSHELRTPMASILGFTEIMLVRDVIPEKRIKYLQTVHNEANRLSGLIDDFLDIQRMESGRQQYHFQPLDIRELLGEMPEHWQDKEKHSLRIDLTEEELLVYADKERILQVLHNLISNAIKYSPDAEAVDVSAGYADNHVVIRVRDYGLGIPEESLPHLFKKFYRVESSRHRKIRGTGLGLAIAKEITESHGGRISVTSRIGEGTEFTVFLPVYHIPQLEGKLAILEDDDGQTKLFCEALGDQYGEIVRFTNAEEAVFVVKRSSGLPWLWIVDIQLEGRMDGWSFIHGLRQHQLYRSTSLVISTVSSQPDHYISESNERFLRKPFKVNDLLHTVDELKTLPGTGQMLVPAYDEQSFILLLHKQGIEIASVSRMGEITRISIKEEGGKG
jgi:signal transduction histidine kinase